MRLCNVAVISFTNSCAAIWNYSVKMLIEAMRKKKKIVYNLKENEIMSMISVCNQLFIRGSYFIAHSGQYCVYTVLCIMGCGMNTTEARKFSLILARVRND